MFETIESAKVTIPYGLYEPDERSWWYVKLSLHIPWFLVTCEIDYGDDEKLTQMLFITQVKHLLELNQTKSIKIERIDLVTPKQMNGGESWEMAPLAEIWLGSEPGISHYQEAFIFILSNGTYHVDSSLKTKKEDLVGMNKIFSISKD